MQELISTSEFSPLIQEYASYKLSLQGCSKKTVEEYLLDLRTFFRYLLAREQKIDPQSEAFNQIDVRVFDLERIGRITTEDIYDFLFYTNQQRGNQWAARSRKLCSIRSLFKYLVSKRHYLDRNPAVDLDTPKAKKTLPKVLSLEEAERLLEAVEQDTESPYRIRDYAILTLFLNCGMRVSELVGISLNDVDPELRSLRVTGKGSKERIIYLNDACRQALAAHLVERTGAKICQRQRQGAVSQPAGAAHQRQNRAGDGIQISEAGGAGRQALFGSQAAPHRSHSDVSVRKC